MALATWRISRSRGPRTSGSWRMDADVSIVQCPRRGPGARGSPRLRERAAGADLLGGSGRGESQEEPSAGRKKTIELGQKIAKINCQTCHGVNGKGDGAAAVALNPKPADWTSSTVQSETDGELFWKISNGRGPMPPWKHLSENDRWAVIRYIRSLKK